jgi:6-phosphogluconolactonase
MPVDGADLDAAAARYAASLPDAIDLVQLGLGTDGHTASLVPGDAALGSSADVAVTAPYQGHRRMTLTFPALNRAGRIVWIVAGADKKDAVAKLLAGDRSIPAARVAGDRAVLIADHAALSRESGAKTGRETLPS